MGRGKTKIIYMIRQCAGHLRKEDRLLPQEANSLERENRVWTVEGAREKPGKTGEVLVITSCTWT